MTPALGLPAALAASLKHVYGCAACNWRGALIDCLDAAEHGLLCPHCFAGAGRLGADERVHFDTGPRYVRHRSAT